MTAAAKPAQYPPDPRRRAMIAKVKIAQKELQLDDAAYRAMLERITRKTSAADCTEAQLTAVLDELKAKGWKPSITGSGKPKSGAAPAPRPADHPVARKARALWISLHQLGEVRDPSERALEAFARRQLGVDKLQWADQSQGYRLIEALKAMAERAGWSQDVAFVDNPVLTLKQRLLTAIHAKLGTPAPKRPLAHLDDTISAAAAELKARADA